MNTNYSMVAILLHCSTAVSLLDTLSQLEASKPFSRMNFTVESQHCKKRCSPSLHYDELHPFTDSLSVTIVDGVVCFAVVLLNIPAA